MRVRGQSCSRAGHHTYYTHHPEDWMFWLIERFGTEYVLELRERAGTHVAPEAEMSDRWMQRCMETFPEGTELQLIAREAVVMTVCADNRVVGGA